MRPGALLAILLVALTGCARLQAVLGLPAPAPAPAPPAASPAPPPAVPPPPPLTPQLSAEEERRLREEAQGRIGETDRLLRQLEGRPMKPQEREAYLTAQRFLDQARKALEAREYQRAANLVGKARALGDDLAKTTK